MIRECLHDFGNFRIPARDFEHFVCQEKIVEVPEVEIREVIRKAPLGRTAGRILMFCNFVALPFNGIRMMVFNYT